MDIGKKQKFWGYDMDLRKLNFEHKRSHRNKKHNCR